MTPSFQKYVVEPSKHHKYTLILLHGLSSNGEKFGRELLDTGVTSQGLKLPDLLPTARFVFPTSRRRRSTAFNRSMLIQWFNIARLNDPSYRQELQLEGLAESAEDIMGIIREELELVPAKNVILGGLSQGCAMSMAVLLCLDYPLGGYLGMSGFLTYQSEIELAVAENDLEEDPDDPFSRDDETTEPQDAVVKAQVFVKDLLGIEQSATPEKAQTSHPTPIFLGHGAQDEKIPCALGLRMAQVMRAVEYEVEWRCYEEQGHWYKIPDEIDDLVDFIRLKVVWELEG